MSVYHDTIMVVRALSFFAVTAFMAWVGIQAMIEDQAGRTGRVERIVRAVSMLCAAGLMWCFGILVVGGALALLDEVPALLGWVTE